MRILQISDSFGASGGLERFIYEFSRRLMDEGHQTTIAAVERGSTEGWGSTRFDTFQLDPDGRRCLPFAKRWEPDLVVWHAGGGSAPNAASVVEYYPTVATVHGVMCPSGMRLFRDRDEVCTVASGVQCMSRWYLRQCGTSKSPLAALESLTRHRQVMNALHRCRRIYAVSKSVQRFLEIEGVSPELVRIFDNTLGDVPALPLSQMTYEKHVKLLYVGRLVYEKGVQYLVQAVRHLSDRGVDVESNIVGDGWYRGKLEDLATNLGVEKKVRFQGSVRGKDLEEWYRWSNIVVIPSIWPDPAPLVVPEARAQGKPVIVTDVGGLPEWAELMNGIFVSKAADVVSLVTEIERIVGGGARASQKVFDHTVERMDLLRDIMQMLNQSISGDGVTSCV
ncbi:glycosyltransferase family 4 protein [Alicyclobacillus curvatus]|nr:glycosyltransferase family 4 protein [Alicyclobacillus curvatus]